MKPGVHTVKTIIGLHIEDLIDPLDIPLYMDTLKKVVAEKTYGFTAYSVKRCLNFLSLLVFCNEKVLSFELARSPMSDKECQKKMLMSAARGLIDDLEICTGHEFLTL